MKYIGCLIGGVLAGIILLLITMNYGGKVEVGYKHPFIKIDFVGAPHQVPINFGKTPPELTLGKALKIIEERTQGRASARVYVSKDVWLGKFVLQNVKPPAGNQPSLDVIKQLLADVGASNDIQICLVPEGGYRVCKKDG